MSREPEPEPEPEAGSPAPPPDYRARAREICLRLLTARARTRAELVDALARRGVPDDAAEEVLGRLGEVGLIDDAAVAKAVVETQLGRGLARRAVAVKLRRRGLADPDIGAALDTIPAGSELAAARTFATRRMRALASLPPEVQARRLAGQLARRGYPPTTVHRVVGEVVRDCPVADEPD